MPFGFREPGPETPEHVGQVQPRAQAGQFPVLVDGARSVAEASINIEYLQMNHPGRVRLIPEAGLALATQRLERAYAWLDGYLGTQTWAAGKHDSMADCAASTALFYADWTYRIPERFAVVCVYRARRLERPSYARAVDEARRFRHFFPLGAPDRD